MQVRSGARQLELLLGWAGEFGERALSIAIAALRARDLRRVERADHAVTAVCPGFSDARADGVALAPAVGQ